MRGMAATWLAGVLLIVTGCRGGELTTSGHSTARQPGSPVDATPGDDLTDLGADSGVLGGDDADFPDGPDLGGDPSPARCGDGVCAAPEDCAMCAADCGACPPLCGDGTCAGAERCTTCADDCGPCPPDCGNDACDEGEDCANCAGDCGVCEPTCGDGACDGAEDCAACPGDCGPCPDACGDGACAAPESCANCARDCGACPARCGDQACNGAETCESCAADCGACPARCGDGACNGNETCGSCVPDCGECPPLGEVPAWAGVLHGTRKVRPGDAVPAGRVAEIEAARNEFEPYQVIVDGGAGGRRIIDVRASPLVGPGNFAIPPAATWIYRAGLYTVLAASNDEGAAGPWPDPMIPLVDPHFGQRRNAFPFDVPANQRHGIWAEVQVPTDAPAGEYRGALTVETNTGVFDVPVVLRVFDFTLPSTSRVRTAFALGWDNACNAHLGSYDACGRDAGIERFNTMYAEAALNHRITLETVVYAWPADYNDWSHFDGLYGPLIEGHANTLLEGARLTTMQVYTLNTNNPEQHARARREHFEQRGWDEMVRQFDYTCDEPPNGCTWQQLQARAPGVQRGGLRTLVTTSLGEARGHGVDQLIDIIVPIMNWTCSGCAFDDRPAYDPWLAANPRRELWWYQSCISHGCGNGCDTSRGVGYTGWPSYVIDAAAIQARAMEWFTFQSDIQGELYFQTTFDLETAWTDQCDFSGSGDGTLFYPGTPARVGGHDHIPIVSMRMKMIREGLEDYEYLATLEALGQGAWAREQVGALFPSFDSVTAAGPAQLYAVRRVLAERIESLR